MRNKRALHIATIVFALFVAAVLAWLTFPPTEDPCASAQADISAAVLGDKPGDQEGLVNRAIIMRGGCEKESGELPPDTEDGQ